MNYFRNILLILTALSLTSCFGPLLNRAEENDSPLITAAPLCEEVPSWITEKDSRDRVPPRGVIAAVSFRSPTSLAGIIKRPRLAA